MSSTDLTDWIYINAYDPETLVLTCWHKDCTVNEGPWGAELLVATSDEPQVTLTDLINAAAKHNREVHHV